ncbi:multifunctional CCA addition/repair protein [Marinobacter bohaiensis]|uniref:multifunctional CCA addition/repair protein n=1 Tax=Marinobacter bohaiensis TaxID=2201898 RepID=UPI000DAB9695|nr:multifunctional CCA addition/repair protein [Marinobacter bohaiensis]
MDIYLVGGAVRDQLLGRPVKDRDWVVVGATPQEMLDWGFKQVGADFPVFLHPETGEEYALARTERKQGQGYHGFVVHSEPDVTLEDDLRRRDLTINAMAQAGDGQIIDPFNGRQDLEARRLRHVSPAFAEDPLRILRVARFAARLAPLGFRVADDTLALMRSMAEAGEVEHLVAERVWQEIQRALLEADPGVFFRVLQQCGALETLMPPLADALGSQRRPTTLQALDAASRHGDRIAVRYAALVAGLGDGNLVDTLSERLKTPNDCRDLARLLADTVDDLLEDAPRDADLLMALLDRTDAWRRPERFADLLDAAEALGQARGQVLDRGPVEIALRQAKTVDPQALMAEGYTGKALGEAIRQTRLERIRQVLAPPAANDPAAPSPDGSSPYD